MVFWSQCLWRRNAVVMWCESEGNVVRCDWQASITALIRINVLTQAVHVACSAPHSHTQRDINSNLSVCPSVRLSHAGTVSKRLNDHETIKAACMVFSVDSQFSYAKDLNEFTDGFVKRRFSINISLYLRHGTRMGHSNYGRLRGNRICSLSKYYEWTSKTPHFVNFGSSCYHWVKPETLIDALRMCWSSQVRAYRPYRYNVTTLVKSRDLFILCPSSIFGMFEATHGRTMSTVVWTTLSNGEVAILLMMTSRRRCDKTWSLRCGQCVVSVVTEVWSVRCGQCVVSVVTQVWSLRCGHRGVQACMRTCYQRNVVERCHCGDPTYPLDGSVAPCSYYNAVQRT